MVETFGKEYKLCLKKDVDRLFKEGKSIRTGVLRILYFAEVSESQELKFLFSVPKKHFKKAVDRNTLKRQLKEICRKSKRGIGMHSMEKHITLHIGIIYQLKEKKTYQEIEQNYLEGIEKINIKLKHEFG